MGRAEARRGLATRRRIVTAPGHRRRRSPRPGQPVSELLPERPTLEAVRRTAEGCKACDLYLRGTQTVFGEGPGRAAIMLVGEQPGDVEDIEGRPFVGPAGRLLDRALEDAGIDRALVYVTNVVKHFKWEPRGKRRLHSRPNPVEVHACRGWLDAELGIVKPDVVVCLGSTAARAFFGRNFRTTARRGEVLDGAPWARKIVITHHPAFVLRLRTAEEAEDARTALVHDLALAGSLVEARAATA